MYLRKLHQRCSMLSLDEICMWLKLRMAIDSCKIDEQIRTWVSWLMSSIKKRISKKWQIVWVNNLLIACIDPSVCGKRHSFGKSQFKNVENIEKKPHLSHWIYLNDWFVSLPKVIKTCNVSYDDRGLKICQIWWRITLYSPKKKSHLLLIGWYHHMLCPSFSDDWWLLNRSAHGVGVNTSLKDENFVFFSYSLSFLKPCEHFFLDFGVIDISIPDVLLRPPYLNETTMLNGSNDDQIFHFNFLHFIVKSDRSFLMNVVMHLPSVAENSVISIGSQIRLRSITVKSPFFAITILITVEKYFEYIESNPKNCSIVLPLFMFSFFHKKQSSSRQRREKSDKSQIYENEPQFIVWLSENHRITSATWCSWTERAQ